MAIFLAGKAVCYRITGLFLLWKVALQMRIRRRLKKAARYYRRAAEAGNKYAAKQLKQLEK